MPARLRLVLMTVTACCIAAGIALVLAAPDPQRSADARGPVIADVTGLMGAKRPPTPPQDFALTDQDGERVRLADVRGRPAIVTFLYSTCEDTCPTEARQIAQALDRLDADEQVPVLAVSVDPGGDTSLTAKRFLAKFGLRGRARFLLGSRAELERVWRLYGIRGQGEGFEHTAHLVIVDAQGRQAVGWPAEKLTPEGLAHDLRVVARRA